MFLIAFLTLIFLKQLCRCGRKKTGIHLIKCMQKSLIKYSEAEADLEPADRTDAPPNIPRTSSALPGFYTSKYAHLEKSTFYVTPKTFLKHKITDSIYDNIIIG